MQAKVTKGATHVLTGGTGLDRFKLSGMSVLNRIGTATFTDLEAGRDSFPVDGAAASQILNAGTNLTYLATGGLQITLATGDLLRFDDGSSQAFWKAYGFTRSGAITGSDAGARIHTGHGTTSVLAGIGDDFIFSGDGADHAMAGGQRFHRHRLGRLGGRWRRWR